MNGRHLMGNVNREMVTPKSGNYYRYVDDLFRRLVRSHDITNLLQVELQPGMHCDLYRCPFCYGQGQGQMEGMVGAADYIRVLDEIKGVVPLIQLAGISSEPTTHPDIVQIVRAIKERGFICGMHTKGYRLNAELRDALTDDIHDVESFVTISVDASNSRDYIDIHDIASGGRDVYRNTAEEYYDTVIGNIRELYALKSKRKSRLRINVGYLLMKQNHAIEDIERIVDQIGDYCDVMRFSLPQARNDGMIHSSYLDGSGTEALEAIREKYQDNPKIKVLTDCNMVTRCTTFKRCYAQIFQAVIDKAGNVFPCPQTVIRDYRWLIYGNIKDASLTEILTSAARKKLFSADVDRDMKCRICDRKDEATNVGLGELFEAEREVRHCQGKGESHESGINWTGLLGEDDPPDHRINGEGAGD